MKSTHLAICQGSQWTVADPATFARFEGEGVAAESDDDLRRMVGERMGVPSSLVRETYGQFYVHCTLTNLPDALQATKGIPGKSVPYGGHRTYTDVARALKPLGHRIERAGTSTFVVDRQWVVGGVVLYDPSVAAEHLERHRRNVEELRRPIGPLKPGRSKLPVGALLMPMFVLIRYTVEQHPILAFRLKDNRHPRSVLVYTHVPHTRRDYVAAIPVLAELCGALFGARLYRKRHPDWSLPWKDLVLSAKAHLKDLAVTPVFARFIRLELKALKKG